MSGLRSMQLQMLAVCVVVGVVMVHPVTAGSCSQGSCLGFSIDKCMGTVSNSGFSQTGFSTSSKSNQLDMICGSGQSGLKDYLFQFAVSTSGLYTVDTFSIGSSDTVMQLTDCSSGNVIGCNDDVSSSDRSSSITTPLTSGKQFTAAVSRFDSSTSEPNFGFAVSPVCLCAAFAPDFCLGTVPVTGSNATGFSTANHANRITFDCGSKTSGLNDFVFQFSVAQSGVYAISTENVVGDTTLEVFTCSSGASVGCNDDRILNVIYSSEVDANLQAGTTYVGMVSKYDTGTSETTFDIAVKPVTSTVQPSRSPTRSPTKKSAQTQRPSTAPSVIQTLQPSVDTSSQDTASPTTESNRTTAASVLDQTGMIAVGGGVGGGIVILALGVAMRRRSTKRRQTLEHERARDVWTPKELARLKRIYQTTQDLDYIYSIFPHKSKESVASQIRTVIALNPDLERPTLAPSSPDHIDDRGQEGYEFASTPMTSIQDNHEARQPEASTTAASKFKSVVRVSVNKMSNRMTSTSLAASEYVQNIFKPNVEPPPGISSANPLFAAPALMGSLPKSSLTREAASTSNNHVNSSMPPPEKKPVPSNHISIDPLSIPPPPSTPPPVLSGLGAKTTVRNAHIMRELDV